MFNKINRKIGKVFIYKKNALFALTFYSLLIFLVLTFSYYKFSKLNDAENRLISFEKKSVSTIAKRKEIKDFIDKKTFFDKCFVEKKLENLTFLDNEKSILANLLLHPSFSNSKHINKRISFINSEQNKLKFLEENIKNSTYIKEADLTQLKSLEIDDMDLQKILAIIEDVPINSFLPDSSSPQLLIKKFSLTKTRENIFSINMKIFKREFYKKKI